MINILLPYKEGFSKKKASSVSITVSNNLIFSKYKNLIKVFGRDLMNPMFKKNFVGIKNSWNLFKSRNENLAIQMCQYINETSISNQIIEIHNRPYLVQVTKNNLKLNHNLCLFFHNDPLQMKGSRSIFEREKLLSITKKIFCVSEYIKTQFLKGIKDDFGKVIVLYNGVLRNSKKLPKKRKEIIFCGRLVEEKGVHLYVEAIKSVYEFAKKWKFSLIGSQKLGSLEQGRYSQNVIKKFKNIGSRVEITGYLSKEKVVTRMQKASIIVIPSIWEEPFGLVAAEAMANGIAIIASDVGGLPEIINSNGILIKNINTKKIAYHIKTLTSNDKLLSKYQNLAWKNFKFDSKKISNLLDKERSKLLALF